LPDAEIGPDKTQESNPVFEAARLGGSFFGWKTSIHVKGKFNPPGSKSVQKRYWQGIIDKDTQAGENRQRGMGRSAMRWQSGATPKGVALLGKKHGAPPLCGGIL